MAELAEETIGAGDTLAGYVVPVWYAEKKLPQLRRLAKRAGVPVRIHATRTVWPAYRRSGSGRMVRIDRMSVECARIEVGELPRETTGYRFVATIEHTREDKRWRNILRKAPGAGDDDLPREFRSCAPTCDHCHTVRSRKCTYVVEDSAGRLVRVGRSCLADYLTESAETLLAYCELLQTLEPDDGDDGFGGGGFAALEVETLHYVACAVASIAHHGFRKSADDAPTKRHAYYLARPCQARDTIHQSAAEQLAQWRAEQPSAEQTALAGEILAWCQEQGEGNDYLYNLSVAAHSTIATDRLGGILASAPTAYNRDIAKRQERERPSRPPNAGHLGAVKQRLDVTATLERVFYVDSDFGTLSIVTWRTSAGHILVWKTTSRTPTGEYAGKAFALRGTVKAHGEFRGEKQTELSRVKWEEQASA